MDFIFGIKEKLQGVKTYLIALIAIATAIVGFTEGTIDIVGTVQAIFAAVTAMTLRGAIATDAAGK